MPDKTIYLLRHGRILPAAGEEQKYIGQLDLPLLSEGIRQAERLRDAFSQCDCSAVYCSDLQRSIETANILASGMKVKPIVINDLKEINMGLWEGKKIREIAEFYPQEYAARGQDIAGYRIPGGETFQEAQKRIVTAFSKLVDAAEGNLIIVGHAGINRLLLCKLLNMPIANMFQICQDYGCVNILLAGRQQYRLKLLNGSAAMSADFIN